MADVLLPIGTLILGYLGSLVTEWFRDARLAERERGAREADREATRADRRAVFQRESLLLLQDALARLMRSAGETFHHDRMASRKAGKWTRTPLEEGTNQRALEANVDVNKYVVRVDDRQLRLLVHQLLGEVAVANATFMETEDEAERNLTQAIQTHTEASMRLGEILRSLD